MSNPTALPDRDDIDHEELAEDVARLKEDAEALASDFPSLPDEIKRAISKLEDQISDLYDTVAAEAARSVEIVEEAVEEHPWTSVFAAFGLGCLVMLLFAPRRRW